MLSRGVICCSGGLFAVQGGYMLTGGLYVEESNKVYRGH